MLLALEPGEQRLLVLGLALGPSLRLLGLGDRLPRRHQPLLRLGPLLGQGRQARGNAGALQLPGRQLRVQPGQVEQCAQAV